MPTFYIVTTSHPTGWQDGDHRFEVRPSAGRPGFHYAKAKHFGCSRDYEGDVTCIYRMCADNACTVVKIAEEN